MAKSNLVPPPFQDWAEFFDPQYDADFKLLALERWYDGLRGRKVQSEPRYNPYMATEIEARMAWAAYRSVQNRHDDAFPADRAPKEYEGRDNGLQLFRPATND